MILLIQLWINRNLIPLLTQSMKKEKYIKIYKDKDMIYYCLSVNLKVPI